MNLIFLGPPGSGKGTQALKIVNLFQMMNISTGDLLREEMSLKTEFGVLSSSFMEKGLLVPDELVIGLIENRVSKSNPFNGFLLDGFPRNIEQAIILNNVLSKIGKKIDIVFNFEIDEGVLLERIKGRFSCKKCNTTYNKLFNNTGVDGVCDICGSSDFESRIDDNEQVLKNRLDIYRKSNLKIIEFYQKNNLIISIDALKSISSVFDDLNNHIIDYKNKNVNS